MIRHISGLHPADFRSGQRLAWAEQWSPPEGRRRMDARALGKKRGAVSGWYLGVRLRHDADE